MRSLRRLVATAAEGLAARLSVPLASIDTGHLPADIEGVERAAGGSKSQTLAQCRRGAAAVGTAAGTATRKALHPAQLGISISGCAIQLGGYNGEGARQRACRPRVFRPAVCAPGSGT